MNSSPVPIKIEAYDRVNDIADVLFHQVNPENIIYFTRSFLLAFEKNHPQLTLKYLEIRSGDNVALAITQTFTIDLEDAASQLILTSKFARAMRCILHGNEVTLQLCGNVFLSGNYGLVSNNSLFINEAYVIVASEMKKQKKPSLRFFKDFKPDHKNQHAQLQETGYHPFEVEPNMVLNIDKQWKNFSDYKNALKSKYRVKVNRADTKSEDLVCRSLEHQEIQEIHSELSALFLQTTDRADFKTVDFNLNTYADLKKDFKKDFTLNGYFLEGQLVGFSTSIAHHDQLDAHFIGINYNINREKSIYPRILNDYVRTSIALNCKVLNLGRTSSEIKSTLGAMPQPLTCYVKHKRSIANLIFKPITKNLKSTVYKHHQPIKQ